MPVGPQSDSEAAMSFSVDELSVEGSGVVAGTPPMDGSRIENDRCER